MVIIMKQTKTELRSQSCTMFISMTHSGTKKALTCEIFYWETWAPTFTVKKRTVDHRVLEFDVPMSLFLSELTSNQQTHSRVFFPVLKQLCILQDLKCFSCSKVTEEFDLQANFKMNGRLNQTSNIKSISIVLTSDPFTFNELS